ncbi:unnamed protein product [Caenorhabditis angaria]|uniref:Uncharacterized protein n=1 Tax=Caenorhabditis angaria TaxID=860376 RepID=A0A9P1N2X3_9PELO|nr:unnamed protein product [Caenorhabditis angaria]
MSYEDLFKTTDERLDFSDWGLDSPPSKRMCKEEEKDPSIKDEQEEMDTTEKRRSPVLSMPKKKHKVTRGDELIEDPELRAAATEILDQFKNSPGFITLNFSSPETTALVPLPSEFINEDPHTNWKPSQIEEGDMKKMLETTEIVKGSLAKIPKICGRVHQTKIQPRNDTLSSVLKTLNQPDRQSDEYIGFASSIANILRRCDDELGEEVAKSIIEIIETQALPQIPKATSL